MTDRKPGTFVKGDPRINRKGRPKSFDALRALAQQLSHEIIESKDGQKQTAVEMILRTLAMKSPKDFLEIAYGKVPQPVDLTTGGKKLEIKVTLSDAKD